MHALAAFVLVVARALPFHVQWHQPLHLVQSGQLISSHVYHPILTIQHYVDIYESSTYRYFKYLPTLIRSRSILSTLLSTPRVRASARLEPAKSSPTRDSLQPPEDSLTLDDQIVEVKVAWLAWQHNQHTSFQWVSGNDHQWSGGIWFSLGCFFMFLRWDPPNPGTSCFSFFLGRSWLLWPHFFLRQFTARALRVLGVPMEPRLVIWKPIKPSS